MPIAGIIAGMERSGGFAIGTYDELHIGSNAEERFSIRYGDKQDRAKQKKLGNIDDEGKITAKGWEQLNKDILVLERNAMAWMRKTFNSARDEGHSDDELVGTFWFDTGKVNQAEMLVMGLRERIDMSDTSYGDLGDTVWKGVSDFGASVLGGAINFFDIDDEAKEEAENVADAAQRARLKSRTKHSRLRQAR